MGLIMKRTCTMLKILQFSILMVICVACGGKSDDLASPNTISFWHFWSEPSQKKAVNELIDKFEKENNCNVVTTELSWNDGKIKLFAAFNSNTAPDVLELGSDWVAQFSHSGILASMNAKEMGIANYEKEFIVPCYYKKQLYAIPWVANTRLIFYNNELFKKAGIPENTPPKTIDEMYAYAERINAIKGAYGFGVNGSDPHRLYKKLIPFMWSFGGEIFDQKGNLNINTPENVRAFEAYASLSRVGIIETQKKLDDMFARGEVGLWISGTWLIDKIKEVNPFLNYSVALFPGVTADKPGISFAGAEYLAINSQSKKQELSKKLIKFLADGKNSLALCKAIKDAGFPADKNYFEDQYFTTLPFMPTFIEQLKHAKLTPQHAKWLDVESALEEAMVEVLYGKKGTYEVLNEITETLGTKIK